MKQRTVPLFLPTSLLILGLVVLMHALHSMLLRRKKRPGRQGPGPARCREGAGVDTARETGKRPRPGDIPLCILATKQITFCGRVEDGAGHGIPAPQQTAQSRTRSLLLESPLAFRASARLFFDRAISDLSHGPKQSPSPPEKAESRGGEVGRVLCLAAGTPVSVPDSLAFADRGLDDLLENVLLLIPRRQAQACMTLQNKKS